MVNQLLLGFRTEGVVMSVTVSNRLRPERIEGRSPRTVPLSRGRPAPTASSTELQNEIGAEISFAELDPDNLREARGLGLSCAIGAAFWTILFVYLWFILSR